MTEWMIRFVRECPVLVVTGLCLSALPILAFGFPHFVQSGVGAYLGLGLVVLSFAMVVVVAFSPSEN